MATFVISLFILGNLQSSKRSIHHIGDRFSGVRCMVNVGILVLVIGTVGIEGLGSEGVPQLWLWI